MNQKLLAPIAWTLFGAIILLLLYGLFRVSTDRSTSPEGGKGIGVMVIGALLVVMGVVGVFLYFAARKQSTSWLVILAVILAYPIIMLIAMPVVQRYKTRSFENDYARTGDFTDPVLASMATAITANDTTTLAQLLNGKAPPPGQDKAGNDLLAFALVYARDRRGHAAPVRTLLQAGADPRLTRVGEHRLDALNFMVLGMTDVGREIVRALLEHKADPNAIDPVNGGTPLGAVAGEPEVVRLLVEHGANIDALQNNGVPPIVSFISQQDWESALYLIEKGANLDIKNADGLSVDYYLKDWKDTIYGAPPPEGWDRVRAAIAARRAKPAADH